MKFARIFATAALLLIAAAAQAGTIHPALQAKMDKAPADETFSVIVNMVQQAPIASMDQALHVRQATRQERHKEILTALQSQMSTQSDLRSFLNQGIRSGAVLGYTSYWISNLLVVQAIKAEIEAIAARADVDVVESNFQPKLIDPIRTPQPGNPELDGTRGIGVTPGLRAIHAPQVWYQLGITGAGRLIGGCDTGVDGSHPALATRWRGYQGANPWQECWLDLVYGGTNFPADHYGHGTHTMGTMTGLGAGTQDTVGVAWGAKWIASNPIDQGVGSGFDSDIVTSYQWFADPDGNPNTIDDVPDVVQNSWGINEGFSGTPPYTDCDTRWWAVLDNCEAAGVCITWSAGNEGPTAGSLRSPADRATTFTNSFSVGAVDATNWQTGFPYPIASWSSRGPSGCNVAAPLKIKPEVCAPGVNVYSSIPGGGYDGTYSGTSMAGPHVAGIVALLRQANPNLDVNSIKQILMDTARDEGTTGEDNNYGWGFVDAYAAVIAATVGFGHIEGHVTNGSYNNVPLAGAQVKLVQTGVTFNTDGSGYYTGSAAANTYTVECSKTGFQTATTQVTITSNQTSTVDFSLIDSGGPDITNVTQIGPTSDTVGPYVINATIFDYSSVASAKLFYSLNHGGWIELPMSNNMNNYTANIPGAPAGSEVDYYVWAQDGVGHASVNPMGAPGSYYSIYITQTVYSYTAEDADANWLMGMPGDNATAGLWNRVVPIGSIRDGQQVHPATDHTPDPGVNCFLTGNGPSYLDGDVDGGCTTLRSPIFDLSTADQAFLSYHRWYAMLGANPNDSLHVDVSSNGGTSWVPLELLTSMQNSWTKVTKDLGQYITLTNQVCFRVKASDYGTTTTVVAGLDDISIDVFTPDMTAVGDSRHVPVDGLAQNRPNPYRAESNVTTITFRISNPAPARLDIFDATGRLVRTLVNEPLQSGVHNISWNGLDDQGHSVTAGVYFYRLKAGAFEQSRRMTILR